MNPLRTTMRSTARSVRFGEGVGARGVRGGILTTVMPSEVKTASNAAVIAVPVPDHKAEGADLITEVHQQVAGGGS